ncbi:hypothetical protein E1263_04740 [Kribbella antibiotica]|uniref:Uncharacterized protein n=1 Tax=Kribbella antibiotica TaxID=190195 RepID=A0A4V2YQI0_9ACTN|nr:hypothetical protein [Kribbella antibiotica]TDD62187.1 hypothetical protein E1263_04740 [Kribbella antibiotica]
MSPNWLFLILIPIVLLCIFFPILVIKKVRRSGVLGAPAGQNPFHQAAGESREDFVRRYWNRSGVVMDGVTLVDLYDRVRVLEGRGPGTEPGAFVSQGPFQQAPGQSREDFVRQHWNRSGVVADGVTLVDLYDRVRVLEGRGPGAEPGAFVSQGPFQQAPGQSREDFVRQHRNRSGVVADGVTLIDLYDRIGVLEGLARTEQKSE